MRACRSPSWSSKPSKAPWPKAGASAPAAAPALIRLAQRKKPSSQYEDGRLARMPLVGGTPRDVAENIHESDWGPMGDIAVTRLQPLPKPSSWLEYPIGKTLLESPADRPLRGPRGRGAALSRATRSQRAADNGSFTPRPSTVTNVEKGLAGDSGPNGGSGWEQAVLRFVAAGFIPAVESSGRADQREARSACQIVDATEPR